MDGALYIADFCGTAMHENWKISTANIFVSHKAESTLSFQHSAECWNVVGNISLFSCSQEHENKGNELFATRWIKACVDLQ
jgi:hypothetical protein